MADLKQAGFTIWERDPLTGKQFAYELYAGHVAAHTDGQIEDVILGLHILEIKSMNAKRFEKFRTAGLAVSDPNYLAQCQTMMGMSGIHHSFFIVYCKDTSEYAIEVINFDELMYSSLLEKAERVMANKAKKISNDPEYWKCRFCFKREPCRGNVDIEPSCNTCRHAVADTTKGGWYCETHERACDQPCDKWAVYRPLPAE